MFTSPSLLSFTLSCFNLVSWTRHPLAVRACTSQPHTPTPLKGIHFARSALLSVANWNKINMDDSEIQEGYSGSALECYWRSKQQYYLCTQWCERWSGFGYWEVNLCFKTAFWMKLLPCIVHTKWLETK